MSGVEGSFCRSAPWRLLSRRAVPWATLGTALTGDVLEIGCGSGAMAEAIASSRPGCRLSLVDVDADMVAAAARRMARFPTTLVREADAARLPFADESFDFVVSFLMLHHVVAWEDAVGEAARVLRPGGRLVGYDLLRTSLARLVHLADRSPYRLLSRGELERAFAEEGLTPVRLSEALRGQLVRFVARRQ